MLRVSFHVDSRELGELLIDQQRIQTLTKLVPSTISLTRAFQPERETVEKFIEQTYAQTYGSLISRHYPTLMHVNDEHGALVSAVGLRLAAEEPLFLESYLDQPIETLLEQKFGQPVHRHQIVEIGNLTSRGKGASAFLFVTLAAYLRQHDLQYAVVTATRSLRRSFALFGFDVIELGEASPNALPDGGASWGSYYTCAPQIVASAIPSAAARMEAFLPLPHNKDLKRLFARQPFPMASAAQ